MLKRAGWLDRYTYEESVELLIEFALEHANRSGRFQAPLRDLLDRRDFAGLLDFAMDYRETDDYMHLYHARQSLAFFQKLEPLRVVSAADRKKSGFHCIREDRSPVFHS